jgi:TP901 family phage tail tape measure protein
MGGSSTTLSIVLKLIDDASAGLAAAGDKFKSVGASISGVGRTLTTDVTLPLAAIGGLSLKAATDFQQAMTLIQTQAGASADEVKNMSAAILDMVSGGAEQTPKELADALFHIESVGLRGADALKALKAASDGAAVGQANLEDVTNALASAIKSGIKGTADFEGTMAVLNSVVGAGNMRMTDLVGALSTGILPAARSAGLSLQDVGAAIALMTSNGVPAEDAATRLRMTFSLMEAPTHQARAALASIGITSNQLADDMRNKGLIPAIQDLADHLEHSGKTATEQAQVIEHAFGGGRTSSAIMTLVQNTGELKNTLDRVNQGVSNFGTDVTVQSQTASARFAEGQAKMQEAAIKFGQALQGPVGAALTMFANALSRIADWFSKLPGPVQTTIVVVLGLVAALGPLLLVIGGAISVIGTLLTAFSAVVPVITAVGAAIAAVGLPVTLLIAAVALLAIVIYTHWNQIIDWTSNLMLTVVSVWNKGWTTVKDFFTSLWSSLKTDILDAINFIDGLLDQLFSKVSSVANKILAPVQTVAGAIGGAINAVGGAIGGAVKAFASGGIVTSPTLALVGEAGPEAIIPLSAFAGGRSLAGVGGAGGGGNIVVNIMGGNYLDSTGATMIANAIGKQIAVQLRLKNFN